MIKLEWEKDEPGYEVSTSLKGFKISRHTDNPQYYDAEITMPLDAFYEESPERALESLYFQLDEAMCRIRNIFAESLGPYLFYLRRERVLPNLCGVKQPLFRLQHIFRRVLALGLEFRPASVESLATNFVIQFPRSP